MNCIFCTISMIIFNSIGPGNTALAVHMPNTPMISTGPIIATNEGSSNAFPTRDLLKAHGKHNS